MKYLRQMIADFLRKLIKLDDYIEDRVFTEINNLGTSIDNLSEDLQNNIEETECHRTDLDDRPTFYDMESHVEYVFGDSTIDVIEDITKRLKKLEDK